MIKYVRQIYSTKQEVIMATYFSDNLTAEQQNQVQQIIQQFQHPTLQKDLIALNTLKKVEKGGDTLRIELK